jgi:hypothetical protein
LRVTVRAGSQRWDATCTNIGPGGGYLTGTLQPLPGSPVQVAVWPDIADGTLLILKGTVAYAVRPGGSRPAGVGVEWHEPDIHRLTALLSRVATEPAQPPARERQTAEFDFNRIGSEGIGITQKYRAIRGAVENSDPH